MITAAEAISTCPAAQLTPTEREEVREALRDLEEHVRATMTLAGPKIARFLVPDMPSHGIEALRARVSGDNPMAAIRLECERAGWKVQIQLMSTPPRMQGAPPIPHHWQVQLIPKDEAYKGLDNLVGNIVH